MKIQTLGGIVSIASCFIGAGIYLGLLNQRVSGLERQVDQKLDKPVPEIICESYNLETIVDLDRSGICPAGHFRFADWFAGTIENQSQRWTLCCRYITQVPHTSQWH